MMRTPSRAPSTPIASSGIPNYHTAPYRPTSDNSAPAVPQIEFLQVSRTHFDELGKYLASCLAKAPADSRSSARQKLTRLTVPQFHVLSTDVYDELCRRKIEQEVPFLPVREGYHPKRNQARQKLAILPAIRFEDLSSDVHFELSRRYPEFKEDSPGERTSADSNYEDWHSTEQSTSSETMGREAEENTGHLIVNNHGAFSGSSNFRIKNPQFTDVTYINNGPINAMPPGATAAIATASAMAGVSVTANIALYHELKWTRADSETVGHISYISKDSINWTVAPFPCTSLGDILKILPEWPYTLQLGSQANGSSYDSGGVGLFSQFDLNALAQAPPMESLCAVLMCIGRCKFNFKKLKKSKIQASSRVL